MCLIYVEPEGKRLSNAAIKYAANRNSDGYGFMYAEGGRVIHKKMVDFTPRKAINISKHHKRRLLVSHVRYKTHGQIITDMSHPFRLTHRNLHGLDIFVMHNGVISDAPIQGEESDTVAFNNLFLKPILQSNPANLFKKEFQKAVKELIGTGNKLCFLTGLGDIVKINEFQEYEDCMVSNTYSLPYESDYEKAYQDDYGSAYGGYYGTGYDRKRNQDDGRIWRQNCIRCNQSHWSTEDCTLVKEGKKASKKDETGSVTPLLESPQETGQDSQKKKGGSVTCKGCGYTGDTFKCQHIHEYACIKCGIRHHVKRRGTEFEYSCPSTRDKLSPRFVQAVFEKTILGQSLPAKSPFKDAQIPNTLSLAFIIENDLEANDLLIEWYETQLKKREIEGKWLFMDLDQLHKWILIHHQGATIPRENLILTYMWLYWEGYSTNPAKHFCDFTPPKVKTMDIRKLAKILYKTLYETFGVLPGKQEAHKMLEDLGHDMKVILCTTCGERVHRNEACSCSPSVH